LGYCALQSERRCWRLASPAVRSRRRSEGEKPAPSWRPRSRRRMSCSIAGKANALVRLLDAPGSSPRVFLQQHRAQFLEARGRVFEGSKDLSPFLDREREDFGPVEQRGIQPAGKHWGNNSGELPEQSLVDGYPTHQHSPCPPGRNLEFPCPRPTVANTLPGSQTLATFAAAPRVLAKQDAAELGQLVRPAERSLARSAAKSACRDDRAWHGRTRRSSK
jgi:hypothetical protein